MDKPFDPSKPVQRRDKRPARVLAVDLKNTNYPIVAAWTDVNGDENLDTYTMEGRAFGGDAGRNLINIPVRRTGWIGIIPVAAGENLMAYASHIYETKEACRLARGPTTIIPIEWDEP